jgi:hypothetical protein
MEKGRIIAICRDDLLKGWDKTCRLACIFIHKMNNMTVVL